MFCNLMNVSISSRACFSSDIVEEGRRGQQRGSVCAGPAVHNHLSSVLPPLLELASRPPEAGSAKADAAREALAKVVGTVAEVRANA